MAKVFLTGANGHVGANTARELLKQGHKVLAFVREGADLRGLDGLEIELRTGNMLNADSVVKGAAGCDAIIHTAAVYRLWARPADEILKPAVDGTHHIFAAAKAHGINRMIYTSSTAAVGRSKTPDKLRDEGDWYETPHSPYYVAKVNSERLATTLAEEHDIELIHLNPSAVLDSYDYRITPTTGVIQNHLNGSGLFFEGGGNYVDVRDVAKLHVQALTQGKAGERYVITGTNYHQKELQSLLAEEFDVQSPWLNVPSFVMRLLGSALGAAAWLTGKPPAFDRKMVKDAAQGYSYYDNSKAREVFNFTPIPLVETLRTSVAWLIHQGMVKDEVAGALHKKVEFDAAWG